MWRYWIICHFQGSQCIIVCISLFPIPACKIRNFWVTKTWLLLCLSGIWGLWSLADLIDGSSIILYFARIAYIWRENEAHKEIEIVRIKEQGEEQRKETGMTVRLQGHMWSIVCVCVHASVYTYACVCVRACTCTYAHVYVHVYVHALRAFMRVHACAYLCKYAYMFVCMCMSGCVCLCVRVCLIVYGWVSDLSLLNFVWIC